MISYNIYTSGNKSKSPKHIPTTMNRTTRMNSGVVVCTFNPIMRPYMPDNQSIDFNDSMNK